MLPALVSGLLSQGLNLVANAALAKGKDWIKDKTGVDLDTPQLSEESLLKLKQFEMEHEEELMALQLEENKVSVELEKARLADVSSARDMQKVALTQNDWLAKHFVYLLASVWSLFAALYIGFITFGNIPETNVRFADTILGFILGTVIATILQFFFGSSRSSQVKDETIKSAVRSMGE